MIQPMMIRERVERARVARLATVGADSRPHLVPICFVVEGSVLYSAVDRKPKRSANLKRIENVRANPEVTVLVDHYDDDWTQLWWVRLDGRARVVATPAVPAQVDPSLGDRPSDRSLAR